MPKVNHYLCGHFYLTLVYALLSSPSAFAAEAAIQIENAWIQEPPPGVSVLAAYGRISNHSDQALALVRASSPDFARIEIHRSIVKDDRVSMEKLDRLPIPAHGFAALMPGDYHLMLFEPARPLVAGDSVRLQLYFDNGQSQGATARVERRRPHEHKPHQHKH